MNYGQLKSQIRDLAFEEDEQMEEYESIVVNAINRAIDQIGIQVTPIRKYIEIEQDGTDVENQEYNMPSLTGGNFLDFDETPVEIGDGDKFVRFNDFERQTKDTLVLSGDTKGVFRIYYTAHHADYTAETDDSVPVPLPLKVHLLVPLLCAYYVWLDDDQQKAVMYRNEYESIAQSVIAKEQEPRMRVRTDWYKRNNANRAYPNVSHDEWRRMY